MLVDNKRGGTNLSSVFCRTASFNVIHYYRNYSLKIRSILNIYEV